MYFKTVMRLWKNGKLPMINGLLKSDDTYFSFTDSGLLISSPLRRINAVDISDVDSMPPLQTTIYTIYFGEGSWGSDGWLLFLAEGIESCWLLSGNINPIAKVSVNGGVLRAINNNGVQFLMPLLFPEKLWKM